MNTLRSAQSIIARPLLLALLISTAFAAQCARHGCNQQAFKNGLYCSFTCRNNPNTPMCCAGWNTCLNCDAKGRPADATADPQALANGAEHCTRSCGRMCKSLWKQGGGTHDHRGRAITTYTPTATVGGGYVAPAPPLPPLPPSSPVSFKDVTRWGPGGGFSYIPKTEKYIVRTYTYNGGITLSDALYFSDTTWNTEFFKTLQNTHFPGKMFYLVWNVKKSDLHKTNFSWKIVMRNVAYSSNGGTHQSFSRFGNRLYDDNQPATHVSGDASTHFHDGKRFMGDVVMVSPGKAVDATGNTNATDTLNNRQMWIGPYMQFTGDAEKTSLWQMAGKVAYQRLCANAQSGLGLDTREVGQWNGMTGGASSWGTQVPSGTTSTGAPLNHTHTLDYCLNNPVDGFDCTGHNEIEINTHGHGVPWLHVRIEAKPQYDPENGRV